MASDGSSFEKEIESNYQWNFGVNTLDAMFHGLGYSFVSSSIILPIYVSKLDNNPILIGLLAAIASSAYLIPQLFAANYIEQLDQKKPIVVKTGFFLERLPFLLMAIACFLFTESNPSLAIILFFIFFTWQGLGEGIVVIAWQDMLAKLFRVEKRGRFFGITGFSETVTAVLGASLTTYVLQSYDFPNNFTMLFFLAFVGFCLAWIFVALTREPRRIVGKPAVSLRAYFKNLPNILNKDKNFRSFLLSRAFLGLGRMGIGFVTVYALLRWELPDSSAGIFAVVFFVAKMFASLVFGFLADKKGHKINIIAELIFIISSMSLLVWANSPFWVYAIVAFIGIDRAVEELSAQVIVFEFATEDDRPTYIGLASTITGVFGGISPLIGGWIVNVWGYNLLFVASIILSAISLIVFFLMVREPRLSESSHKPIISEVTK